MENDKSPSVAVKRLDGEIRQILRKADLAEFGSGVRNQIADLQQNLSDARIYSQAYESSETREEQLSNSKTAKAWLLKARKCILSASESDIFGAIDVAHLSAQIDLIISKLR